MSDLKLITKERQQNTGIIMAEYWHNTGRILTKYQQNTGRIVAKYWQNTSRMLAEYWQNTCRILVGTGRQVADIKQLTVICRNMQQISNFEQQGAQV